MSITTRTRLLFLTLVFALTIALAATARAADCSATDGLTEADGVIFGPNMPQWQRWQRLITSDTNYNEGNGNPSRDLVLELTFTRCDTDKDVIHKTRGFWYGLREDGQTLDPHTFRIRGAFPQGTWQWVLTCRRRDGEGHEGTQDCREDTKLNAKGVFEVGGPEEGAGLLYDRGFLRLSRKKEKPNSLVFDNGERFFWLGDTVWNANVLMDDGAWTTLINDRSNSFTILQLGMAPDAALRAKPGAEQPFERISGCSDGAEGPGRCFRLNPKFWHAMDEKVLKANQNGIVVVLASFIHPISKDAEDVPTDPDEATFFAENIVGRMAGNFVIFSPAFDHTVGDNLDVIDPVGSTINAADQFTQFVDRRQQTTSRHLITNHAAGRSSYQDYTEILHTRPWLNFQLFQSGTPGSGNGEEVCQNIGGGQQSELCNLTERSVLLAKKISKLGKPAFNGESVYPGQDPFAKNHTPYRARQTAYYSMLSGAQGYSMGTCRVFDWETAPGFGGCQWTGTWEHEGAQRTANTMRILRSHFQSIPLWLNLQPQSKRIQNQPQDNPPGKQAKQMVLAYDKKSALLAYVPNEVPSIQIDFREVEDEEEDEVFRPVQGFPNKWVAFWLNPREAADPIPATRTGSGGVFTFTKPDAGSDRADCEESPTPAATPCNDWVLRITKKGKTQPATSNTVIQVISGVSSPSQTSLVKRQVTDSEGNVLSQIELGTDAFGSPGAPQIVSEAGGNSMVVWQAQTATATTILGRVLDDQGNPVTNEFVIANGKAAYPGHPSVEALANGDFIVAWAGVDKYNRGPWIRTRRYSRMGVAQGAASFAVACNYIAGDFPQVAPIGTGNGYVVAWEMVHENGIYVLQVDGAGKSEARLEEGSLSTPALETLEGSTGSAVTVSYGLYAENGSTVGGGDNVTVTPQLTSCGPPPLAVDDAFTTQTGKKITIAIEELLENDAPGITLQSIGSKCPLTASGRACTYTPASGFAGDDTFSYTVRNSAGVTGSAVVTITVFGSQPGDPVANPDSFTVERGQTLTITSTQLLANDSPNAKFGGAHDAVNGSISCAGSNPATCIFTPNLAGTASFKYNISWTGNAPFVTGTVTITVTEPTPPLQASFTVSCVNRTCTVHPTSTGPITRWQWNWGDGTVTEPGPGDQSHTYAHSGGYNITHTVFDAGAGSSFAQRAVVANTAPIANPDSATTCRGTAVTIDVLANDSDPDGDPLNGPDVIVHPSHGTAVREGTKIKYTPATGFAGPDSFTYQIRDPLGEPASAGVTITVNSCGKPVARNDQAFTKRDTPVTINLLANDQDPEGQAIWLTVNPIKTPPRHGTVTIVDPFTTVRYTPDANWGGNDVFEYQIADASGEKDRAWVAVHVGRTRSLPVAVDDTAATTANRGVTIHVLDNDSSPDGDPITLTRHPFISKPLHGRVTRVSDSHVSYTPQADWTGTDTFAYEISDSEYGTAAAFVTVTVTSENRPPVANPDTATTSAGVSVTIVVTGNDTDLDGDPLTLISDPIVVAPQHGTATRASASSITYTPAPGYAGSDTFDYVISDGHDRTAQGTVTITISATNTNHPPVAVDDDVVTTAGVPVTIEVTANDSDVDGDQISLITNPIITGPENGTAVKVNGSSITYTPRSGYTGTDRFQYEISDHNGAPAQAWVDITIGAGTVNHNPVAVDDEVTMLESHTKDFIVTANDYDPDGDTVALISSPITFAPAHGTATRLNDTTIRYTPAAGYVGMDTLQYEIGDGRGKRSRAWMRVMVRDANSRPEAVGDEASTTAGTPVTVNVTANDYDPDGDVVRLIASTSPIITPPENGTATKVDADRIKYTPQATFSGTDRFQYEISDGRGGRHRAWVNITVSGGSGSSLNSITTSSTTGVPPLAGNDATEAFTDTPVDVVVLSNDLTANGESVVLTANPIVTPPLFGTAQRANDTTLTYTPSAAFRGNDRIEYEVVNANGVKTTAWVTVQIPGDNKAPVALSDVATAAKDGSVVITPASNDTDENADALILTVRAVVIVPQNGTVRRESDTQLLYTPAPGFIGDDTFVYEITDRRGGTAQASVVVHVIGGAQQPVAINDSATVQSGRAVAVNVVVNDSDPDGDAVRVVASEPPQHGTILWSGGTATYQSHSGYVGADSFRYTISDPTGLTAQGTVSVTVSVVNHSTNASNDSVETKTRTPILIGVLANDYDPDPQRLTVASVTQPARGTVAISTNRLSVTYTPANDFAGNETFQYTVTDGLGSVTASVAVKVLNQAPWPHSEILSAPEDTWVGYQSFHVIGNDVDPDGDELHIVSVEQPAHGQFLIAPDSSQFSYQSSPNWHGMDSFYYTVSDPFGAQVRVFSQIAVSPRNDSPVANDDAFSVYKNQILTITQAQVVANDTDIEGHEISVYSVGPATNGTTKMLEDGSIEYTPYGEFVGTDSFEYTAQDSGGGAYATGRITVNVLQDTVPVANFTVSCNGFTCAFDASSSTDDRGIVSYQWLLKTGAPSSTPAAGKTFSFTYPNEGVFEARLTVQDVLGQTAVAVKWVTICAPPGIGSQPASQTIFAGYTATLSVTASGTGPFSYQWYEGTAGTTTTPVGTNNSTFTTPGLSANKSYWVRVTSTCSGSSISVNSNTATVTVCQLPGIATQPASKTINSGSTATLSVVASGSGPFTYQWYDADTNTYAGSGSTYTTPALTATKSYWVRVTSTCNGSINVVSNIATVTVCDLPVITTHPAPKLINAGATTTLTVAASGSGPFSYQWYEGASGTTTTPVGTNSDTFTTPPLASTKSYWARVTSACNGNTANSNAATVTVCQAPGFATQPASKTIPTGTSTTLTVVPSGSGPFSYQWYEGTAPNTTTPVGTNSSSYTTPVLTTNKSYWVRVTSWCNGNAIANSSTATITMGCAAPPSISASPTSRTIIAGQSTTLSVTASGFGTLTYQWYQGTAPSTATPVGTNSSSLTVTPGATTNYWVMVSNACGGTASATATVTYCNPPVITAHPASTTINYNATATLSVVATGTGPFSYQWYEGASGVTTIPVGTNSASFTTPPLGATKSYWVRVSNACSTNSNAATVTVNGAALARRQFAASTANSQLTITTNWTQPTQAGNLLVAIVSAERGWYPIANWQPPAGWQHAVTYEMTHLKTSIYYYPNNPGGRTAETFGNGGYYDDMILQLAEYTGVVTVSPLDRTALNGNTYNDGYVDTGYTPQTSQTKELVITALTSYSMTEFYGPSNGFLELNDRNQGWGNLTTAVHERFTPTAGSWGHDAQVGTQAEWIGVVATFRASN